MDRLRIILILQSLMVTTTANAGGLHFWDACRALFGIPVQSSTVSPIKQSEQRPQEPVQARANQILWVPVVPDYSVMPQAKLLAESRAAGERYLKYFDAVSAPFLERDYLRPLMETTVLGGLNLLLTGGPGGAKTEYPEFILSNIVVDFRNPETGEISTMPSFFMIQVTEETSLLETHGPPDFVRLTSGDGRIRRHYDDGAFGSHFNLIDEFGDARKGTIRNFLDLMRNRTHAQGRLRHKGFTHAFVASTNKTLADLYERAGNDDPKAVIDRFQLVAMVSSELQYLESHERLGARDLEAVKKTLKPLHFNDVMLLNELASRVDLPAHIRHLTGLLFHDLRPVFEGRENSSFTDYLARRNLGETNIAQPYRSTKYQTSRTEHGLFWFFKVWVALDYIYKKGQRSLVVSTEDMAIAEKFLSLNATNDEDLKLILSRAVFPNDQQLCETACFERPEVREAIKTLVTDFNQTVHDLGFSDLENAQFANNEAMITALAQTYQQFNTLEIKGLKMTDVTAKIIAQLYIKRTIESIVEKKLGTLEKAKAALLSAAPALPARPAP